MSTPQLAPEMSLRRSMRRRSIATVVVGILFGWVAVDAGLRLLPLTWFDIADAQIARRWHPRDAPFAPDVSLRTSYYRGNEAAEGNLPSTETRPPRHFRTDEFGFRYAPPVRPGEPPEVVVLRGFSFSWGAQLDDRETFAATLARDLGVNVYNGSRLHEDSETPADVARVFRQAQAKHPVALYLHLEPNGHEPSWDRPTALDRLGPEIASTVRWLRILVPTWLRISPLDAIVTRASKSVHNDRILANPYRDKVVSFQLPDGRRMLVRRGDLERMQHPPEAATIAARAEYIEKWAANLTGMGAKPLVVLVPEKMSVYGAALGVAVPADPYLNRLDRELQKRGMRTLNLLPPLLAQASKDLATGRLMYFREDEHWNPAGVERMAGLAADAVRKAGLLPARVEQTENAR